jgi:hypothetical protein
MAKKRNSKAERLNEVVSYRISSFQRTCLEKYADEHGLGIGETCRELLNAGIKSRGITA